MRGARRDPGEIQAWIVLVLFPKPRSKHVHRIYKDLRFLLRVLDEDDKIESHARLNPVDRVFPCRDVTQTLVVLLSILHIPRRVVRSK